MSSVHHLISIFRRFDGCETTIINNNKITISPAPAKLVAICETINFKSKRKLGKATIIEIKIYSESTTSCCDGDKFARSKHLHNDQQQIISQCLCFCLHVTHKKNKKKQNKTKTKRTSKSVNGFGRTTAGGGDVCCT